MQVRADHVVHAAGRMAFQFERGVHHLLETDVGSGREAGTIGDLGPGAQQGKGASALGHGSAFEAAGIDHSHQVEGPKGRKIAGYHVHHGGTGGFQVGDDRLASGVIERDPLGHPEHVLVGGALRRRGAVRPFRGGRRIGERRQGLGVATKPQPVADHERGRCKRHSLAAAATMFRRAETRRWQVGHKSASSRCAAADAPPASVNDRCNRWAASR